MWPRLCLCASFLLPLHVGLIQRVLINIVLGEIANYIKGWSDKQVKSYKILKPMVLHIIGEKIKKIHQCKPEISLIL